MRLTASLDTLSPPLSSFFSPSHLGLTNPPLRFRFGVRISVQQLSFALTQAASRSSLQKKGEHEAHRATEDTVARCAAHSWLCADLIVSRIRGRDILSAHLGFVRS